MSYLEIKLTMTKPPPTYTQYDTEDNSSLLVTKPEQKVDTEDNSSPPVHK